METIDQKLNGYVWDNLDKLKSIFSKKVYEVLSKQKEKEDKDGFFDTLGVAIDSNNELLEKLKSKSEDINNMSIKEVVDALKLTSYDNFIDKKIYIDRAEYWINNYKKKDESYASLLNNLAGLYRLMGAYEKAKPLYLKALKIREKLLGEEHPNTATTYNNLAGLY
jgi:tetratricopeptide (TPR) repeat protein